MKKYKFGSHVSYRTVTVKAKDEESARMKALDVLDRRVEKAGIEPPVSWALYVISIIELYGY
jgi:hypothetical protein